MKNLPPIMKDHVETETETETESIIHPVATAPTEDEDDVNNTNINTNEDEEAMRQASRHRQHAQNMVREHLEHHSSHNPGASSDYVTWIATLHPENADITIDQRFFVPGNAWWTIYEDTKNNPIPVVTAVPVANCDIVKEEEDLEAGTETTLPPETASRASTSTTASTNSPTSTKPPHCCQTCNPIALVAGMLVTIPAFVTVLTLELVALVICYLPSAVFYHASQAFAPPNICTCILYMVFMILYGAFSLADSIVLVTSVVATEWIGGFAFGIGFLTGGCLWAKTLQQHIRRLCHCIRVGFRRNDDQNQASSMPRRSLCCCGSSARERKHKADRERGINVVRVQRVRSPGESCH